KSVIFQARTPPLDGSGPAEAHCAVLPSLVELYDPVLDKLPVVVEVLLDLRGELFRSVFDRFDALVGERLKHFRRLRSLIAGLIELGDDFRRRSGGGRDAEEADRG